MSSRQLLDTGGGGIKDFPKQFILLMALIQERHRFAVDYVKIYAMVMIGDVYSKALSLRRGARVEFFN